MKKINLIVLTFIAFLAFNSNSAIAQKWESENREIFSWSKLTDFKYFIEKGNNETITIHTERRLTSLGMEIVYGALNEQYRIVSCEDKLTKNCKPLPITENLSKIEGLTAIFVSKYSVQISKSASIQWEKLIPQILQSMEIALQAKMRPTSPPDTTICAEVTNNPEALSLAEGKKWIKEEKVRQTQDPTRSQIEYSTVTIDCAPNPDMVTMTFDMQLTEKSFERYDYAGDTEDSMALIGASVIPGIDSVYIRENQMTIGKGSVFKWNVLLPRLLSLFSIGELYSPKAKLISPIIVKSEKPFDQNSLLSFSKIDSLIPMFKQKEYQYSSKSKGRLWMSKPEPLWR